ncbi:MAG: TIGR02186 family protein [Rhodospirillales bacterium]
MIRSLVHVPVLLTILALASSAPSRAELIADLSSHLVAITTGFTGAKVLLFGTTGGSGDVVVVVRGPEDAKVVRRKGRRAGVWINEAEMVFERVPSFYALAANRPIDEFLPARVAEREEIGLANMRIRPPEGVDPSEVEAFRAGLIRSKQKARLYGVEAGRITFLGQTLFRTDMFFPANAPTGTYIIRVFLVEDGEIVGANITPLVISKIGFEAGVFDFAHRHSLAYGVLAILIAAVAGWLASVVFHKD